MRLGFNPGELLDFMFGFFKIDIFDDDIFTAAYFSGVDEVNKEQEETLENLGINIENLPQEITPGMEKSFIDKLGIDRVKEIEEGDMPSVSEFLKSKDCISK